MPEPINHNRIDEIEVLRAVAVTMVFVEHVPLNLYFWHSGLQDWMNAYWHGTCGVDLFFAISGFVIARRLLPRLSALSDTTEYLAATLTFFVRRFWRLQPAAVLWLLIPLLLGLTFNRSGWFRGLQGNLACALNALVAISNFRFGTITPGQDAGIMFQYWSLSLEEQFYLLLPLLAFFLRKRLTLLMFIVLAYQFVMPRGNIFIFTRPGAIAVGVLLAIWSNTPHYALCEPRFLARGPLTRLAFAASTLALMGMLVSWVPLPLFSVPVGLMTVLCGVLVYTASFGRGYLMRAGPLRSATIWLGSRSYAIYLIHIPAFSLIRELNFRYAPPVWAVTNQLAASRLIEGIIVTLCFAELNYRLVEQPFRRYGRKQTVRVPENLTVAA